MAAFLCFLGILLFTGNEVIAVNVDLDHVLVHSGPEQSKFGFSVAMHVSDGRPMLLVGAPTDSPSRSDASNSGSVYSCSVDGERCQQLAMDREGTRRNLSGTPIEDKSNQWFGSTLVSGGEDGHVLACAILYQHHFNGDSSMYRLPIGNCFLCDAELNFVSRLSPCEFKTPHHTSQGSCQAGFSAAVDKKSGQVVLGAVGAYQWQGAGYAYDIASQQSMASTDKKGRRFDDSYMGYATAIGEFTGDNKPEIVLGVPKGAQYNGTVEFYHREGRRLSNLSVALTGSQLGSYFGSAIAVTDLNGDGLDDVIVGAPLYTDFSVRNQSEKGRVHIFYQSAPLEFIEGTPLDGTDSNGRFGFSVAALNDINRDGYNDLAVGAPYAQDGVVYIFHGGKNGIKTKAAQKIEPRQLKRSVKSFGFSLSGGIDLDRNGYPDLLVGAYASDKVLYFRSRPIINVQSTLKIDRNSIKLEDESCSLPDGSSLPCFNVELCFDLSSPTNIETARIEYQIVLDINSRVSRAIFLDTPERSINSTVTMKIGASQCVSKKAVVKRNPADKMSPISINASYSLVQEQSSYQIHDYTSELTAVLSSTDPLNGTVEIKKNCGSDDVCIPDLKLSMNPNITEFEIGSTRQFAVEVSTVNEGEDAFSTKLLMTYHNDLDFVKVDKDNRQDPVSCSGARRVSAFYQQMLCDLDNPLKSSETLNFRMIFAANKNVPSVTNLEFKAYVNSTNEEKTSTVKDNEVVFSLPVKVRVNVVISGKSDPVETYYNASAVDKSRQIVVDKEIGPIIQHVYQISNKGHDLDQADVYLVWPTHNIENEPLLYLFERPSFRASRPGMINCESLEHFEVNPNKVLISEGHSRQRRDNEKFRTDIGCGQLSKCGQFKCRVKNFTSADVIIVTVNSRLWLQTVAKARKDKIVISSKLIVNPVKLRFDIHTDLPHEVFYVQTTAVAEDLLPVPGIPWWVIVLAIIIGILLLSLLIWILYKVGFFRRKRPGEPLDERGTKNGYHTVETIPKDNRY